MTGKLLQYLQIITINEADKLHIYLYP